MKKAVYLGSTTHLQSAFSPETRREISGLVEILGDDIDVSCLGNRAGDLAGAQIILSTWGMPKLDRNLLELVSCLEAVFYAAGSVGPEIARMGRWMAGELRKYLAGDPLNHSVSEAMIATMA